MKEPVLTTDSKPQTLSYLWQYKVSHDGPQQHNKVYGGGMDAPVPSTGRQEGDESMKEWEGLSTMPQYCFSTLSGPPSQFASPNALSQISNTDSSTLNYTSSTLSSVQLASNLCSQRRFLITIGTSTINIASKMAAISGTEEHVHWLKEFFPLLNNTAIQRQQGFGPPKSLSQWPL